MLDILHINVTMRNLNAPFFIYFYDVPKSMNSCTKVVHASATKYIQKRMFKKYIQKDK